MTGACSVEEVRVERFVECGQVVAGGEVAVEEAHQPLIEWAQLHGGSAIGAVGVENAVGKDAESARGPRDWVSSSNVKCRSSFPSNTSLARST